MSPILNVRGGAAAGREVEASPDGEGVEPAGAEVRAGAEAGAVVAAGLGAGAAEAPTWGGSASNRLAKSPMLLRSTKNAVKASTTRMTHDQTLWFSNARTSSLNLVSLTLSMLAGLLGCGQLHASLLKHQQIRLFDESFPSCYASYVAGGARGRDSAPSPWPARNPLTPNN